MTNYYQILGLGPRADSTQIRAAYKRMAMAYHPDHNPGYPEAEEIFKLVNEAYHTLSDPLKKARYDEQMFPQYHRTVLESTYVRRQRYAYQSRQRRAYYKVDKEYFRHQGLSILVYIVLAGFCFALMNAIQYYVELKQVRAQREKSLELKQASVLFGAGKFDDAFAMVRGLTEKPPLEFRIHITLDSLVKALKDKADLSFDRKDYSNSTALYLVLRKYEDPVNIETIRRISMGQYYLGNYRESLNAMQQLYEDHPNNTELVYSIALINLDKMNNAAEALKYFNLAKSLLNKNGSEATLTQVSKTSSPDELTDEVYAGSAEANIALGNFADGLADCNIAIENNPFDGNMYKLRALANAKLRRLDTVCDDILRAKKFGVTDTQEFEHQFCR